MKKNDIVICIDPCKTLTAGGVYIVYEANKNNVKVCNCNGDYKWYSKKCFSREQSIFTNPGLSIPKHLAKKIKETVKKMNEKRSEGVGIINKSESISKPVDKELDYTKYRKNIKNVIFNGPATIVYLKDGRKGVSKLQAGDVYHKDAGFWCAYAKAIEKPKRINGFESVLPILTNEYVFPALDPAKIIKEFDMAMSRFNSKSIGKNLK